MGSPPFSMARFGVILNTLASTLSTFAPVTENVYRLVEILENGHSVGLELGSRRFALRSGRSGRPSEVMTNDDAGVEIIVTSPRAS